jgi:hypothetical protein
MWELLFRLTVVAGRVFAKVNKSGPSALVASLTLPFSRGGEEFRTSLFEHHLFSTGCRFALTRSFGFEIHALERQQDVGDLLAVARLLEVGDLAAAAIGDAGLRDL